MLGDVSAPSPICNGGRYVFKCFDYHWIFDSFDHVILKNGVHRENDANDTVFMMLYLQCEFFGMFDNSGCSSFFYSSRQYAQKK